MLTQDRAVFEESLDWLQAVLVRVGLPGVLALSLDTLASVSSELPDLQDLLAHGRAHLG